jgi:Flp pilus assembly protein TadG
MFRSRSKTRAQTMVELALVLPIILLVVLGLIEFGRAFFYYTMISGGAREGARYGCVHMEDGQAAVESGVREAVYSRLLLIPTDTVTVTIAYDDGVNPYPNGYIGAAGHLGDSRVVVEVRAPFSMVTPIISEIFPSTTIHFTSARTTQTWVKVTKPTPAP